MKNPHTSMTCTEAVRQTVQRWPIGEMKMGPALCDEVRDILSLHGARDRPMDGTILRRMREIANEYGVEHMRGNESKYIKIKKAQRSCPISINHEQKQDGEV